MLQVSSKLKDSTKVSFFEGRVYRSTSLIRNRTCLGHTVGLCVGPYGGLRRGAVPYERGTPVGGARLGMTSEQWLQGSHTLCPSLRFLGECAQRFAVETKDTVSPEGVNT